MDEELKSLIDEAMTERDDIEASNNVDDNTQKVEEVEEQDIEEENNDVEEVEADGDEKPEVKENESEDNFEVKVNGQTITLDNKEELQKFISNQKKDVIKSDIELLAEQNGLEVNDLALLASIKKGDKKALAKFLKDNNVDDLDIDLDEGDDYEEQTKVDRPSELDQVANEILADEVVAQKFKDTVTNIQDDHPEFIQLIASDPKMLKTFGGHIKNGFAEKVLPLAIKKAILEGGTLMDHYTSVGDKLLQENNRDSKKTSNKDRAAAGENPSTKSTKDKTEYSADDIFNMSDEDFASGKWK